jgi:hypothetical protein
VAERCPHLSADGTRCAQCGAAYVCPRQSRYFLYALLGDETIEREVTQAQFCAAERAAGFRPALPSTDPFYMTTPATGGFRSGFGGGRVTSGVSPSDSKTLSPLDADALPEGGRQ